MKIQLDTANDTVTILEDVDLNELVYFLENTTPKRDWKIIANSFRIPTEDKSLFKDYMNPVQENLYSTNGSILWCTGDTSRTSLTNGGSISTTGNDLDIDKTK